jgi:hypothetical protein
VHRSCRPAPRGSPASHGARTPRRGVAAAARALPGESPVCVALHSRRDARGRAQPAKRSPQNLRRAAWFIDQDGAAYTYRPARPGPALPRPAPPECVPRMRAERAHLTHPPRNLLPPPPRPQGGVRARSTDGRNCTSLDDTVCGQLGVEAWPPYFAKNSLLWLDYDRDRGTLQARLPPAPAPAPAAAALRVGAASRGLPVLTAHGVGGGRSR